MHCTSHILSLFRLRGLAALLGAFALIVPMTASASHYRLPVARLIDEAESAILKQYGVQTTLSLLSRVATATERKRFAKESGIALKKLETWAHQVDLLRVEGIGPSMVLVLQAAGIKNTRDLARTNASALLARMEAANERGKITEVLPRKPGLHAWILQARELPALLEGLGH